MVKKLSYICFSILVFLDKIFKIITKRSVLIWFNDFNQERSYKSIKILDTEIKFFVPNQITNWRVDTYFSKEPETLEWIDSFEKKENLIFWDIGANIGLYSIYNSLKNPKSTTIAFEPSSSNLRVLTRNISINNLEKNIKVISMPLTNKKVKSLSIEVNENFKEYYNNILNLMNKYEFKFLHKKNNEEIAQSDFKHIYNYIFVKQN